MGSHLRVRCASIILRGLMCRDLALTLTDSRYYFVQRGRLRLRSTNLTYFLLGIGDLIFIKGHTSDLRSCSPVHHSLFRPLAGICSRPVPILSDLVIFVLVANLGNSPWLKRRSGSINMSQLTLIRLRYRSFPLWLRATIVFTHKKSSENPSNSF